MKDSQDYLEEVRKGKTKSDLLVRTTELDNHCVADIVDGVHRRFQKYTDGPPGHASVARPKTHDIIERFHKRAGTLTEGVIDALSEYLSGAPILRVAHQPNLLPYRGVMGQFILLDTVARSLQQQYADRVARVYLIVDHDTCQNHRFKKAHFPDPLRNQGITPISFTFENNTPQTMMAAADAPALEAVDNWVKTLHNCATSHNSKLPPTHRLGVHPEQLRERRDQLQELLRMASERSENAAEFNSIVISRIVNRWWNLPILFLPLSDCTRLLQPHYEFLIRNWSRVRDAASQTIKAFESIGVRFSSNIRDSLSKVPFWYMCPSCMARNPINNEYGSIRVKTECTGCGRLLSMSFGRWTAPDITCDEGKIAPRAILDDLLDMVGFNVVGGVGYQSSVEHVIIAHSVATRLGWSPPSEIYWRPYGYDKTPSEVLADKALTSSSSNQPHVRNAERALNTVFTGRATIAYNILFKGRHDLRNRMQTYLQPDINLAEPLADRESLRID